MFFFFCRCLFHSFLNTLPNDSSSLFTPNASLRLLRPPLPPPFLRRRFASYHGDLAEELRRWFCAWSAAGLEDRIDPLCRPSLPASLPHASASSAPSSCFNRENGSDIRN
ncbi:unnamed protein product [Urochloa humidicola]